MRYTAPSSCASLREATFLKLATVEISLRHTIAAVPISAMITNRMLASTIASTFTHPGVRFFVLSSAMSSLRSLFLSENPFTL